MKKFALSIAAATIAITSCPANADDIKGSIGIGALAVPEYEGAEDMQIVPLLTGRVSKNHNYIELRGLGARANISPTSAVEFGPSVRFRFGRDDDVNNDTLAQLDEIDSAFEGGAFISIPINGILSQRDQLAFGAEVLTDISGVHEGYLIEFGPSYSFMPTNKLRLSTSLSARYTSDNFAETYYSVNNAESIRTGLNPFNAKSGINDAGATMVGNYAFNDRWGLIGLAGYQVLLGDAKDSPVVDQEGNNTQFIAGMGITYNF